MKNKIFYDFECLSSVLIIANFLKSCFKGAREIAQQLRALAEVQI